MILLSSELPRQSKTLLCFDYEYHKTINYDLHNTIFYDNNNTINHITIKS